MNHFCKICFTALMICCLSLPSFSQKSSEKKNIHSIGLFAGINGGAPSTNDLDFITESRLGFQIGAYYRSGRWIYGQFGVTYFYSNSNFTSGASQPVTLSGALKNGKIQIPLLAGLNLLPPKQHVFNIHIFAGIVPGFIISTKGNDVGIEGDDMNTVQFDGTVGVGLDLLFLRLEGGFDYGFVDLLQQYKSHPKYWYLNLAFRL